MLYCKFASEFGPQYAVVEERDGEPWATAWMPPPEEDLRVRLAAAVFQPRPLSALKLLPPVAPSKIVCIGRNYADHAAELGNELPKEPLLFLKAPSSLIGPGDPIVLTPLSQRVDFEGELGVVIGKTCRNIGPDEDVFQYIRGYVCVNDVTARDLQKKDGQWTRGKGFDTFCPVGPLVTDELDFARPIGVTTRLNGVVKQHGTTADLIFSIATILRYITAAMTLHPGDLIPTGTPAGVGPMQAGDVVEVEVEGIGILRNPVQAG